jgi:aminoglycoside 6'-N-acetyltransferase
MTVFFRPLQRADFPLLGAWLAEPLVARWWHHDPRPAAIERDFGPSIDRADPTEIFIASGAHRPFGLVQRYRIDDNPEWGEELSMVWPVPPRALSIDYLIGEPACRGRGLAAAMIAGFVEHAWDRYPDSGDVVVPVAAANRPSWRALERAGFQRVASGELTPDNPIDTRDHVVYHCRRPAVAS